MSKPHRLTELTPLSELSRVALRSAQTAKDGKQVPAGATGTVVDTLGRGQAYIVEFVRPFHALLTIEAQELAPVHER